MGGIKLKKHRIIGASILFFLISTSAVTSWASNLSLRCVSGDEGGATNYTSDGQLAALDGFLKYEVMNIEITNRSCILKADGKKISPRLSFNDDQETIECIGMAPSRTNASREDAWRIKINRYTGQARYFANYNAPDTGYYDEKAVTYQQTFTCKKDKALF